MAPKNSWRDRLRAFFPAATPPGANARRHAVEIEINHRRGEERQKLAEQQSADDRDAERMPQLRSRTVAEHQRQSAEYRRQRRHQDRAETQQRRLEDGFTRGLAFLAFRRN